jgi:hypothetical protein
MLPAVGVTASKPVGVPHDMQKLCVAATRAPVCARTHVRARQCVLVHTLPYARAHIWECVHMCVCTHVRSCVCACGTGRWGWGAWALGGTHTCGSHGLHGGDRRGSDGCVKEGGGIPQLPQKASAHPACHTKQVGQVCYKSREPLRHPLVRFASFFILFPPSATTHVIGRVYARTGCGGGGGGGSLGGDVSGICGTTN